MTHYLYQPFRDFRFNDEVCFLSGAALLVKESIPVFPLWLMEQQDLESKPFKLLDDSITSYGKLLLPCSPVAKEQIDILEKEIENVFLAGFDAVVSTERIKLFQWISRVVYGLIYHEIKIMIRQQHAQGEKINMSQSLIHKFSHLHVMLQSLIRTVVFENFEPWSIEVFKVKPSENNFSYRDEMNTLTFSLRMHDFGMIACLQDNGANAKYHQSILERIKSQKLSPIQFEELCGRFFYSAYLFNRLPEYNILFTNEAIFIEAMPLKGTSGRPIFDSWNNKTYGQVLENFWRPWEYSLLEIIKNPQQPITFLPSNA